MGLEPEMEWILKRHYTNMNLEMELTPDNQFRLDGGETRDGSGDGVGVPDNYLRLDGGETRDGSRDGVDLPNQLGLDRGGARHGVEPLSPKVRHIWDWNQRWIGPSKGTAQI